MDGARRKAAACSLKSQIGGINVEGWAPECRSSGAVSAPLPLIPVRRRLPARGGL